MKALFLVRHAKSSRDDPDLPDRDRPLDNRGQHEAPEMGHRLADRKVRPDLILSSPALRALTTAQLLADQIGYARQDIVVDDRLYPGDEESMLAVVHGLDKTLSSIMLFGHNPAISALASQLLGRGLDMPTCAVVELRYDTKLWRDIGLIEPKKMKLETPKS